MPGVKRENHSPACPYCGSRRSDVMETKSHPTYSAVSRRRRCVECHRSWTTDELPVFEGQHALGHVRKPRPDESPDQ